MTVRRRLLATLVGVLALLAATTACSSSSPSDPRDRSRPSGPFWVDPNSEAAQAAARDPSFAGIADQPTALTVGGWLGDPGHIIANAVAQSRSARQTLVLQVYDIPHRDVGGGYSAGGASSDAAYLAFTRQLIQGLGDLPTVIVLEPDSLGQMGQLSRSQADDRYALLRKAVGLYHPHRNLYVYLDGTNSGWLPAAEMARRLVRADVADAQGFAVNVSNFYPTGQEVARAEQISALTGHAHFVVDTSRNGGSVIQGHQSSWCNPPHRRLGQAPTTDTGLADADAFLWVKHPGESDGNCAPGQPVAGQFWPAYARQLIGLPTGQK